MSFLRRMQQAEGGEIRFITAQEKGKPCWFYLYVSPDRFVEYKRQIKNEHMNIAELGTILKSGWGAYPSENVIHYIKEEFDFETPKKVG
jgi:hypothetical protein